jgi:phospholipid transport system transporter-binding protein
VTRRDGNRLLLEGPVGVGTVATLLTVGAGHVREGVAVVDFAAVTAVDSAAVALALALVREARAAGRDLAFANVPAALSELAKLYGVSDLIQLTAPRQ